MGRRSKRTKTVNNNNNLQTSSEERTNFDEIPHDLLIEIFGRLPVKSVRRFLTVSKLWEKTIRSPDFFRSYPRGSSSQPRTLIAFDLNLNKFSSRVKFQGDLHFFKPSSSSSTSFISRLTCPFIYHQQREYHYHHVNGLISVGYGQEQIITNPITGEFRTLPRAKTRRKLVKSFFGYDSVSDQYKVLCMTERLNGHYEEPSSQHQVFTLGAKKESWRMIECSIPHRPCSNGVCINGVVYYVAKTGAGMLHMSLMRFDLRSDNTLDLLTSLPEEVQTTSLYDRFLINYEGKVAIPTQPTSYTFEVWVMNQEGGKHEWLKKITFSIEPWKSNYIDYLRVRGTTHTGEFILAPTNYTDEFYVFHYNSDKNSFKKIMIQVPAVYKSKLHHKRAFVFSDYVESVRFLTEKKRKE